MLPYWLIFVVFAIGALMANRRVIAAGPDGYHVQNTSSLPLVAAAMIPLVLMGFRYEVGADWYNYERIFDYIRYSKFWNAITTTEPAYGLLNWIAAQNDIGIWLVNLVCAAIFIFGLVRFAQQQPNPWLTVLIAVPYLIIVVGMGYTRQGTAIGCVMLGLMSLSKGSFFRFVLWIGAAAMFHRSALVLIPLVGLAYSRDRLQTSVLVLASLLVGYFFVLPSAMENYSASYLENAYEAQGAGIRMAMNALPAAIFLLFSTRFGLNPVERKVWRMFAFAAFGCVALFFLLESSTIADRLGLYLIPLQLLVFSRLPHAFGSQGYPSYAFVIAGVGYSSAVQFVWLNYAEHASAWLPYKWYPLFSSPVY